MSENERVSCPIEFDDPNIQAGRFQNTDQSNTYLFKPEVKRIAEEANWQPQIVPLSNLNYIIPQQPCGMPEIYSGINSVLTMPEEVQYEFERAYGKSLANLLETTEKAKLKENTSTTNRMTSEGFVRGTTFPDQTVSFHRLTDGKLLKGKKFILGEDEYFVLQIRNERTGVLKMTDLLNVASLESERYVENLITQYFSPSDDRVYSKESIKDFKASLHDYLQQLIPERVIECVGWYRTPHYALVDGKNFPLKDSLIASIRKPEKVDGANIDEVLAELCIELEKTDFDNRLRALLIYGMEAWFSRIIGLDYVRYSNLIIMGDEMVCRKYAQAFLKLYHRVNEADLMSLEEISEKVLSEYIKVIRDDVLVLDCYETERKMRILRALVSRRTVAGRKVELPIALLSSKYISQMELSDTRVIDLFGFSCNERIFQGLETLKSILVQSIERNYLKEEMIAQNASSEDSVIEFVSLYLMRAGANSCLVKQFIFELQKGAAVLEHQKKRNQEIASELFRQRIRKLISSGQIRFADFSQEVRGNEEEFAVWKKGGLLYFPVKYLRRNILTIMDMSFKEFKQIRNFLIAKEFLICYDSGKELTKDLTLPSGRRVGAYVIKGDYFYGKE